MRFLLLSCFLFFINSLSLAEDISMNDFAKGIELETEGQSAIYRIDLPEDVYKTVTNKHFSDIRVFNQSDEVVPHLVREQESPQSVLKETIALPFFPIKTKASDNGQNELDVTVSSEGKIVRFQSAGEQSDSDVTKYYLIDISHVSYPIESIDLEVEQENDAGYTKKIKLEYSQDLNHWMDLVSQATLTELNYGNYILKNTRINLPDRKAKYLRLSWLEEVDDLTISKISASLSKNRKSNRLNWSHAQLLHVANNPKRFEFDTGGLYYINQVDVQLPEINTLIDVTLKSRENDKSDWMTQYNGVFYRLKMNDVEITGHPVAVRPSKHRYWQVELKSTEGMGKISPVLKYGWNANQLYFLARGTGPYILAYGNANLDENYAPPSSLKNIIYQGKKTGMVSEALPGREINLKGESALEVKKILPWQRIILWFVLVTGVFITAYMVFRLLKQMELK